MKKFLYFCLLITICLNAMAQIDPYDRNWDTFLYDDFSTYRTWDSINWRSSDLKWKALAGNGITHGNGGNEKQIYQYQNCVFDTTDNTMKLISEYDWGDRIPAHNYSLPSGMHGNYPNILGQNNGVIGVDKWYYFSGEIDVNEQPFHYGYFEIEAPFSIEYGGEFTVIIQECPTNQ